MSMKENPYSPSTLDLDDTSSVSILNRVVCYALALACMAGFVLALLLALAMIHRAVSFAYVFPSSAVFLYVFTTAVYVCTACGFILAMRKSLRMDVRPAFYWAAACALSLGFAWRFAGVIDWIFRRWGGLLGVVALFGVCMLLVYRRSLFRTFRATTDEATLVEVGGTCVQKQRAFDGPTLHCVLCDKEVQVDEDERCMECGWPI
jgi:DNA-directed RNA polymerase subunit RPC12/RpoP